MGLEGLKACFVIAVLGGTAACCGANAHAASAITIASATLPRVATIDPRFLSYNVEMAEVIGGKFWKPYTAASIAAMQAATMFQKRTPIGLSNPRLRALAKALGPAYVRVSGTWAKTFLDSFRYLDQLGRLARRGVAVVFHNTLASSEYGMLDSNTFEPRPDYWAAWLWHRLMGTASSMPARLGPACICTRNARAGIPAA